MDFTGKCEADAPGRELEKFNGKVEFKGRNFTLTNNQMLLKGASLRNTKWVIGFAVYTGEDTRIMMNSIFKTNRKVAKIDKQLNSFII